jgi:hypothetical protein
MAEKLRLNLGERTVNIHSTMSDKKPSLSFSVASNRCQPISKKTSNSLSLTSNKSPRFNRQAHIVDEDRQSESSIDEKNKSSELGGLRGAGIPSKPVVSIIASAHKPPNTIVTQLDTQLQINPNNSRISQNDVSSSKLNVALKKTPALSPIHHNTLLNNSLGNSSNISSINENEPLCPVVDNTFQNNSLMAPSLNANESLSRKSSFNSVR